MTKLFIIGNGFDKAHQLKTDYTDFRDWLKSDIQNNNYEYDFENIPALPSLEENREGDFFPDTNESKKFFYWLFENVRNKLDYENDNLLWQDFEKNLSQLDLETVLSNEDVFVTDNKYRDNEISSEFANQIKIAVKSIPCILNEWINTIELDKAKKKIDIENLFRGNNLYLTFNYTETLEQVYNILLDQICHIHGARNDNYYNSYYYEYNESILVTGHNKIFEDINNNTEDSDDYDDFNLEADNILIKALKYLYKDTDNIIKTNASFFTKIKSSHITEIYSYGFSFSDVDLPYIKHICELLDTSNITWFLNSFDDKGRRNELQKIITNCGFKGQFDTYSVS